LNGSEVVTFCRFSVLPIHYHGILLRMRKKPEVDFRFSGGMAI